MTGKMAAECESDAILNFCKIEDRKFVTKGKLWSLMSRIFWVT